MFDTSIYDPNILDLLIIVIYFVIIILHSIKYSFNYRFFYLAIIIGILHLAMSIAFNYYSLSVPSDSKGYFRNSIEDDVWSSFGFGDGTIFISQLIYPFTKLLGVSYLGSNLIFSLISLSGVYKLYSVSIGIYKNWSWWFLLFLLPSIHFWTGFIGKDALLFFGISSLLYNAFFKKSIAHYILPVFLIMFARLYILVFLLVAFLLAVVFLSKKMKLYQKLFIGIFGLASIIYLIPRFLNLLGINDINKVSERRDLILEANMEGGSGIDLSSSNLPMRFFSYLFRPFVFEAHSLTSLIAAMENILWLAIFFIIVRNFRKIIRHQDTLFWFVFGSFFTVVLPAAYILSNLGIAARQKIMIVPFLFYVFFIVLQRKRLLLYEGVTYYQRS